MQDNDLRMALEHLHGEAIAASSCIVQLYSLIIPLRPLLPAERGAEFDLSLKEFENRVTKLLAELDGWSKYRG